MATETRTLGGLAELKGETASPDAPPRPLDPARIDGQGGACARGRGNGAVPRVWLQRGDGRLVVDGKVFTACFARRALQRLLQQALTPGKRARQCDLIATLQGR